jgi:hypothetical protein
MNSSEKAALMRGKFPLSHLIMFFVPFQPYALPFLFTPIDKNP